MYGGDGAEIGYVPWSADDEQVVGGRPRYTRRLSAPYDPGTALFLAPV